MESVTNTSTQVGLEQLDNLGTSGDGIGSEAELEEQFGELVLSMFLLDEIFEFIAENE